MSVTEFVGATTAAATMSFGSAVGAARETVAEMLVGEGGIGLLVIGTLGVLVLVVDVARMSVRIASRARGRAGSRAPVSHPARAAQARALAVSGAAPGEIAQRTGLSRDALALVGARRAAEEEGRTNLPPAETAAGSAVVHGDAAAPAPADSFTLTLRSARRRAGIEVAA